MVITDTHNTLHARWQHVEPWGQHTSQRVTVYSPQMLHLSAHILCWELGNSSLIILSADDYMVPIPWSTDSWVNLKDHAMRFIAKYFSTSYQQNYIIQKHDALKVSLYISSLLFSWPFFIFTFFYLFMSYSSFHQKVFLGKGLLKSFTLN